MSETKLVVKPQEIDAISLDKFLCLVDNVLTSLEGAKKETVTEEAPEVMESASTLLESDGTNGLVSLDILGGSTGPMMVLNLDTRTNKYVKIYSNAAVAASVVGLNPTTIRQRCKDNKTVDNVQWSYIDEEEYKSLKS